MIAKLDNINSNQKVNILLKEINTAITLLYKLTDEHYTNYIFNGSSEISSELEKLESDFSFSDMANKLEKVRSLLYGDTIINWKKLSQEIDTITNNVIVSKKQEFHDKLDKYLIKQNISFVQQMEKLNLSKIKNADDLFLNYQYLTHKDKIIIDKWLQGELVFYEIDEICEVN